MLCPAVNKLKKSWLDSDEIITISSDSEDEDQGHSVTENEKPVSNNLEKDAKVEIGTKRSPELPAVSPIKKSRLIEEHPDNDEANKESEKAISNQSLQSSVNRSIHDNPNHKKDSANQTESTVPFPAKTNAKSVLPRKKNKKVAPVMRISKSLFARDSTPRPAVNDFTDPGVVSKSKGSDSHTSTGNSRNKDAIKLKGTEPVIVLKNVKSSLNTEHLRQLQLYEQSQLAKKDESQSNSAENQCSPSKTNSHATFEALNSSKTPAILDGELPRQKIVTQTARSNQPGSNTSNSETASHKTSSSNAKLNTPVTIDSGSEKGSAYLSPSVSIKKTSEVQKRRADTTTISTGEEESVKNKTLTSKSPVREITGHGEVKIKRKQVGRRSQNKATFTGEELVKNELHTSKSPVREITARSDVERKRKQVGKKSQNKANCNGYQSILRVQSDAASNGQAETSRIPTSRRSVSVALYTSCCEKYQRAAAADRAEHRPPFLGVKINKRTISNSNKTGDSGKISHGATVSAESEMSSTSNKEPTKIPSNVSLAVNLGAKDVRATNPKQRVGMPSSDAGIKVRVPFTNSESSSDLDFANSVRSTDSDNKVSSKKRRQILSVKSKKRISDSEDDFPPKRQGEAGKRTRGGKRTRTSPVTSRASKRKHGSSTDSVQGTQSSGSETRPLHTTIKLRKRKPVQYSESAQSSRNTQMQAVEIVDNKKFHHIVLKEMKGLSEIVITVEATEHKPPESIYFRKFNYLFKRTLKELIEAFQICKRKDECKVVVLSSVGPVFCSGLNPMTLLDWTPGLSKNRDIVKLMKKLVSTLIKFKKMIVAVVQGAAVGFGATLLLHCDSVYTSDRATIQWPFIQIGLPPFGCTTEAMTMSVGACKTRSLLLEGDVITAKSAKEIGIVSEIFPHDSLTRNAMARCIAICQSPAYALLQTKSLLKNDSIKKKLKECNYSEIVHLKNCLPDPSCRDRLRQYVARQSQLS